MNHQPGSLESPLGLDTTRSEAECLAAAELADYMTVLIAKRPTLFADLPLGELAYPLESICNKASLKATFRQCDRLVHLVDQTITDAVSQSRRLAHPNDPQPTLRDAVTYHLWEARDTWPSVLRDTTHALEKAARVRAAAPTTGRCPCECNSGGFCGGCGHAGCGLR